MARAWTWWIALSIGGLVTILLPDTGPRLFSLSEDHGPSLIDLVGIVLLVAGWVVLDLATWRRRSNLAMPRAIVVTYALVGSGSVALVASSVLGDQGSWWVVGAALLATIQIAAAVRATIAERSLAHR